MASGPSIVLTNGSRVCEIRGLTRRECQGTVEPVDDRIDCLQRPGMSAFLSELLGECRVSLSVQVTHRMTAGPSPPTKTS